MPTMTFDVWVAEVYKFNPDDFNNYAEWYSFYDAWDEGKTPQEAYEDCREWMAQ